MPGSTVGKKKKRLCSSCSTEPVFKKGALVDCEALRDEMILSLENGKSFCQFVL